eukprot:1299335-Ditylum_brightwellii.AAC.1
MQEFSFGALTQKSHHPDLLSDHLGAETNNDNQPDDAPNESQYQHQLCSPTKHDVPLANTLHTLSHDIYTITG